MLEYPKNRYLLVGTSTTAMDETTILLVPAPGARPEFLATVEPIGSSGTSKSGDLPFEVVLSSYTRDAWAMSCPPPPPSPESAHWKSTWLKSVDGRGKLPGFLKYLRERKKVPFGRFDSTDASSASGKGVIMVPFDQPTPPPGLLGDGSDASVDDLIYCAYVLDESNIGRGYRQPGLPRTAAHAQQQKQVKQQQSLKRQHHEVTPVAEASSPKQPVKSSRATSGMLGNLLGATRKTNTKLDTLPTRKAQPSASATGSADGRSGGSTAISGSGAVVAKFRQDVEQKLLDFKQDVTLTCLKVPVSIGDVTRDLPLDQKQSVTMDILKYVVYEQAEEVGEDRWIAAREPSEFLDECVVAVYKEGHAPESVLEDLNKGELPDEIVQQQRAMRQARVKEVARKETKEDELRRKATVGSGAPDGGAWTLNVEKRDRRTIEEIQKEMESQKKRQRS